MSTRRTILLTTGDDQSQLAHAPVSFSALTAYLESLYSLPANRLHLFGSNKTAITNDRTLQKVLKETRFTPIIYVEKSLIGLPAQRPPAVDYVLRFTARNQLQLQQVADLSVTTLSSTVMDWTGRVCLYPPDWVLFTGGEDRPKSAILVSISDNGKIERLKDMSYSRAWHGLCVMDGAAYVVGGKDPQSGLSLKSTEVMTDEDWATLGQLNHPRESVAVIAHREVVYAVGGFDGTARLQTIEAMKRGRWTELPTCLPEPRQMPGLVFMTDGQLMVVGGHDEKRAKRSVFLVDVEKRSVDTVPALPIPDYFTGRQLVTKESGEVWVFGKQTYIYFPSYRMWATLPSATQHALPS